MVMKAGKASVISSKFISTTVDNINSPTVTRAADVAAAGIIENTGKKKAAITKHPAVERAVSPVLPPSATPDELSTKVVIVDVPKSAPKVVPTASAIKALLASGKFPSSSSIFALVATPVRVPRVSKISTKRKENKTENISSENTLEKSSLKAIGDTDGGRLMMFESGNLVKPRIRESIVDTKIPQSRAPLTCLAVKTNITVRAKKNISASRDFKFPKARAGSALTIIFAFERPISAINRPIPTDTAFFRVVGMALKIASLTPKKESRIKIIPSKKTAVKANSQLLPICPTTV